MTGHGRRARHSRRRYGPWGGFESRGPFGRGRKASRGDMRAAILALLAEEPMHGYQIITEISSRSGGVWNPSPGSVYPTLQQLSDEGLLSSSEVEGRRVYELTDAGRTEAQTRTGPLPWEQVGEEGESDLVALREVSFQVIAAAHQVARAGDDRQLQAAQKILREARKSLYQLLANDEEPGGPEGTSTV